MILFELMIQCQKLVPSLWTESEFNLCSSYEYVGLVCNVVKQVRSKQSWKADNILGKKRKIFRKTQV